MINPARSAFHRIGKWYCDTVTARAFRKQTFFRINERPTELGFVFRHLSATNPRHVLDVGCGRSALPRLMRDCGFLVTAIDNTTDYWPSGMFNPHYHVVDADITASQPLARMDTKFDVVTCVSTLEHIGNHDDAIDNMLKLLRPGGHLILTCPYTELTYNSNVYQLADSSYGKQNVYVCQSYSRTEVDHWTRGGRAQVVAQEFWRYWEGEFWTCGKQILPPESAGAGEPHQLTCLLIRKKAIE